MDWQVEFDMAVRVVVSAILGGVIGWERQLEGRAAGILTYAAVSLGSCCFGLISTYAAGEHDPGRIAAQVVSGIGFLGAGVILRERGQFKGLTTAATLWATASVGMAVSFGMYILGVLSSMILFVLLSMGQLRDDVDEEDEPRK